MLHVTPECDVSVIVVFSDHEEVAGRAFTAVTEHLRGRALRFEVLAVDEGSVDNTGMVLRLLGRTIPELRVIDAERVPAAETGARAARGKWLFVLDLHGRPLLDVPGVLADLDRGLEMLADLADDVLALPGLTIARRKVCSTDWRLTVRALAAHSVRRVGRARLLGALRRSAYAPVGVRSAGRG